MKNNSKIFIYLTTVILAGLCLLLLPGCSIGKAARQPGKKNVSFLNKGTPRAIVISEFGPPLITESINMEKVDTFKFIQGYSGGVKFVRATFHGVADVLSFGLWEIVGTPFENIANGTEVLIQVTYDADTKVKEVQYYKGGNVLR